MGIEPGNLCLEVTESLAINDMVRMKRILSEIKALGVKVALDDLEQDIHHSTISGRCLLISLK